MKKDIYIAILEFGEHQGLLGATARDLYAHLHTEGYISDAELEHFNKGTYNEDEGIKTKHSKIVYLFRSVFPDTVNSKDGDTTYLMSMDSYFKLIEYKEIVLARESATSARRYSLWAIGLAVTSLVVSIVFSFMQIHTPTTLNNAQLKELTTSAFDDTDVIANINTLSENQKLSNKLLMELKSKIVESKD